MRLHDMKSTPSRINSDLPLPSCYVCGYPNTGGYNLAIRQTTPPSSYFPFLETHEAPEGANPPSSDGVVKSCYVCHSYLNQQWLSYESEKVPPVKRLYWLKRVDNGPYTGVEVGVQSEYASQLLGFTPEPPNNATINTPVDSRHIPLVRPAPPPSIPIPIINEEKKPIRLPPPAIVHQMPRNTFLPPMTGLQLNPLDLSVESKRGVKRPAEEPAVESNRAAHVPVKSEVLDLSMPDKDAVTEVCYVCGDHHQRGTLVHIFAKPTDEAPFFPSLIDHPRPSGSRPMEASGRVLGCNNCYTFLLNQWNKFEAQNKSQASRLYSFRKPKTFICYKCGLNSKLDSLRLVYCKENDDEEPYFPEIEKLPLLAGASSISPQGMVQMCQGCYGTLSKSINSTKKLSGEIKLHDDKNTDSRTEKHFNTNSSLELKNFDTASCYLCHQNYQIQLMKWISMTLEKSTSGGAFFSFLTFLPRLSNAIVNDGCVLTCSQCFHHLMSQWAEFEKDKIPLHQRQFSLRVPPLTSQSPRLTPGPRLSPPVATSSNIIENNSNIKSLDKSKLGYNGQSLKELEVSLRIETNVMELPANTSQRPLNISINCYVCGMHSKRGQTYAASSIKSEKFDYFFPFLSKHASAHAEARIDSTTFLICHCCFHSLVIQWQDYERKEIEHYARLYDTYNFSCYICDIKTYRKRLYQLPIKDYPFLKDHNSPPGGMIVDDGHAVVVCKDCYSSLNDQKNAVGWSNKESMSVITSTGKTAVSPIDGKVSPSTLFDSSTSTKEDKDASREISAASHTHEKIGINNETSVSKCETISTNLMKSS